MGGEDRTVGVIKFYNPRKGYGFVSHSAGSDVFFHLSHLRHSFLPVPGHVVRFTLGHNREGQVATDIDVVQLTEVDRYDAVIESLNDESGVAITDDDFRVQFLRCDYLPRRDAETLEVGQLVELNLLVDEGEAFRARVVRPREWAPEAATDPHERRSGDDEDENRRLLGVLYKTADEAEAVNAARLLVERNMRAALSALVARVFDPRLSLDARTAMASWLPRIYFDEEVRGYLEAASEAAIADLEAPEGATPVSARMLWTNEFPVRWSQYLLPFGLSLLRALAAWPPAQAELRTAQAAESTEQWLGRVWRHVAQQRSGCSYVTTIALSTFEELWRQGLMHDLVRRSLDELFGSLTAETLAYQIRFMSEAMDADFARVLLPAMTRHPDLVRTLRDHDRAMSFVHWVEAMLSGPEPPSPAAVLTLAPLLEAELEPSVRAALASQLQPYLRADTLVAALRSGELPDQAGWVSLNVLRATGQLPDWTHAPDDRAALVAWLQRAIPGLSNAATNDATVEAALALAGELAADHAVEGATEFVAAVGRAVTRRIEQAPPQRLPDLLPNCPPQVAPEIVSGLLDRVAGEALPADAAAACNTWLAMAHPLLPQVARRLAEWRAAPDDPARLNALIEAVQASRGTPVTTAAVAREVALSLDRIAAEYAAAGLACVAGLVLRVEEADDGERLAEVAGCDMLLPDSLFLDPLDCTLYRYVRLILRRGSVLGVASASPEVAATRLGRLAAPLRVTRDGRVTGRLIAADGQTAFFDLVSLADAGALPPAGTLLWFAPHPLPAGAEYDVVALQARYPVPSDLSALLDAAVASQDDLLAAAALRAALAETRPDDAARWQAAWAKLSEARREQWPAGLEEAEATLLTSLIARA